MTHSYESLSLTVTQHIIGIKRDGTGQDLAGKKKKKSQGHKIDRMGVKINEFKSLIYHFLAICDCL